MLKLVIYGLGKAWKDIKNNLNYDNVCIVGAIDKRCIKETDIDMIPVDKIGLVPLL